MTKGVLCSCNLPCSQQAERLYFLVMVMVLNEILSCARHPIPFLIKHIIFIFPAVPTDKHRTAFMQECWKILLDLGFISRKRLCSYLLIIDMAKHCELASSHRIRWSDGELRAASLSRSCRATFQTCNWPEHTVLMFLI